MAVDKFKFVSPGVFVDEVDESAIPELPERMGPLIVGRFQKGPAHRPVQINSLHLPTAGPQQAHLRFVSFTLHLLRYDSSESMGVAVSWTFRTL